MEMETRMLLEALKQKTEPDSHVLCRLVRNHVNLNDISILDKAVFIAVQRDFLNSVRILLEAGASPNFTSQWRITPLHVCSAEKRGTGMVRELLKYGANVNAENKEKKTPLHHASRFGCVENMQQLLKNGAMVDAEDNRGDTPLLLAILLSRNISAVQVLLSAGADVNHRDEAGVSPLHIAVDNGSLELVRLLLRHNADANGRDNSGDTPLHRLIRYDRDSSKLIAELCKGGAILNVLDCGGYSALYCAIEYENVEATQQLLRYGAPFDLVECLEVIDYFSSGHLYKINAIVQELIRYVFIQNPDSLENIRPQLMQDRVVCDLREYSIPECNLEDFKHSCLSEVETSSKLSCDCSRSSIWGSINNCGDCMCDTQQATLKFLFSGKNTNFSDAFFYKLSKEFLLEVSLNLVSYFEFEESKKRVLLNGDCVKELERYVSLEEAISFLQSKQSKMGAFEFEKYLAFMKGKSSSDINPPGTKRLRVS